MLYDNNIVFLSYELLQAYCCNIVLKLEYFSFILKPVEFSSSQGDNTYFLYFMYFAMLFSNMLSNCFVMPGDFCLLFRSTSTVTQ